jgi:hypothetical protein
MVVLPLIGRLKITVLDVEFAPGTDPVIVGRESSVVSGFSQTSAPSISGGTK